MKSPGELATQTGPDILEVVSRYTSLQKIGREFFGLALCHNDRHPSLRVNPDKQLWYCDPCSRGGDIIEFIKIIEGVDFKGALAFLGMSDDAPPPPNVRQAARQISEWVNQQIEKMNGRLHELDEMIELADEIGDPEVAESLWNERRVLGDMRDDLRRSEYWPDFIQVKDIIVKITQSFEA